MTQIEAIYEGGVFRPVEAVQLPEKQRVRLTVQPVSAEDFQAWWERVKRRRQEIFEKHGLLRDSTLDIAEDRQR